MSFPRGLNQKTAPHLDWPAFLDLASASGCDGVEARDDLGRPFFDGAAPAAVARDLRARGLRLFGLSEVYGFNAAEDPPLGAIRALLDTAAEAGAEGVNLVPCVQGEATLAPGAALDRLAGMLGDDAPPVLVEPIGFATSSLRHAADVEAAIRAAGLAGRVGIVHDTFQVALAGDAGVRTDAVAMVHVSGLSDPDVDLDMDQDAHRVLVDAADRCRTADQVAALRAGGYAGPVSMECTAGSVQRHPDPAPYIRASFDLIAERCRS